MFSSDCYLGCPNGVGALVAFHDDLNSKVVEQVNDSQELMMLNTFSQESNEYHLKKCIQQRICELASWQWVLKDLSKRLSESLDALRYEHNALRVVVDRVRKEIEGHSAESTKPGALCPCSDGVEEAIMLEYKFLKEQKKGFEKLIMDLEQETSKVEKIKSKIDHDILVKQKTIEGEEKLAKELDAKTGSSVRKKRRRSSPLPKWEKRCSSLKSAGLQALTNAIVTRQQVRGARVQLSIAAVAHASRVDAALRRRLHANSSKLEELKWQREEGLRDLKALDEELLTTEQSLVENLDKVRLVEGRLSERNLRPPGEVTRDEVDKSLRNELSRLRRFIKGLRDNIQRITYLKNLLTAAITKIDNIADDLAKVVSLDTDRIHYRLGETIENTPPVASSIDHGDTEIENHIHEDHRNSSPSLPTINEDDEEDDYPFDY